MTEPDPDAEWPLSDRLQMLAFEAQLAHLPRSLVAALWEVIPVGYLSYRPVQAAAPLPQGTAQAFSSPSH